MFEECGRKALTDQKEKQMSDIRSKDMDQHNRVCAQIDLDAIAYNMEQMKDQIGKEARLIAVIKTDGYGHGAVPIARMRCLFGKKELKNRSLYLAVFFRINMKR